MNYSLKINLLKLKNSCLVTVKGKTASKRGIFIPIEDNHLFVSADEDLKAKGAYIDCIAWENQQPGKFGDTHSLRQSLTKEVRERMSEEEKSAVPFIGNMKPYEQPNAANSVSAPETAVDENIDDLPF